ncbi:MAG: hypothetical protein KatS3mg011_0976 [Acidimicrobiia bacterium]|nr:MAG: hypothetical protein KatS3mg011_0976 [Acidimicrobiia bacterium]
MDGGGVRFGHLRASTGGLDHLTGTLARVTFPSPVDRLRRLALLIWTAIGALILFAFLVWGAGQVRIIWLPLAFAAGLVILLDPIVRAFERILIPRVVGSVFAFAVFGAFLAAVVALIVPVVREQAAAFGQTLPELYDRSVTWLQGVAADLGIDPEGLWTSERIREWIADPANQEAIQGLIGGFGSGAGRLLRGVAEVVAVVGLAPVLAFYMLLDLPRSRRLMLELTPPSIRDEVAFVTTQVGRALGAFVRGQLLVAIIVGVLSSFGLWLLDLPFWLLIGIAAGILNLVPFAGPFVGGALAAIVALLEGDFTKAVLAVAIFTAIQQTDNHVITPMVQRTRVRLSPLVIVLALIAGGSVAGLLGVLVAVPVVGVVRIVAGHLWRTRVLGESWEQASEAMIEETPRPEGRRRRRLQEEKLFDTAELPSLEEEPEKQP